MQQKAEELGLTWAGGWGVGGRPSVLSLGPSAALCKQFSSYADLILAAQANSHDHEEGKAEGRDKLVLVNAGEVLGPPAVAAWPLVAQPP